MLYIKGDYMKVEEAKMKIINHNIKLTNEKQERIKKTNIEREKLINEIKKLKPRIQNIIEIGNFCIDNNIDIGQRTLSSQKYKKNQFETDGVGHQLGFYSYGINNNIWRGEFNHYKYIGYSMGGICGDKDFITNGDLVANCKHDHPENIVEQISIYHCKDFLKDFPIFEKAFYDFINKL